MPQLFQRRAQVVVDGVLVEGLRCVFKATKNVKPEPNTLDLSIYNLSPQTRGAMKKWGAKVIVQAGYAGSPLGQVFSGDARTIDHTRQGPDWVTRIQCGDGEVAYQFNRVSASFGPGAKLVDIAAKVAGAAGLGVGNLHTELAKGVDVAQFVKGYQVHGRASTELDKLMRTAGLEWSIQDGELQVLRPDKPAPGEAILLSADTGLVGSPEHGAPQKAGKPSVLKLRTLLMSRIKPGTLLKVDALATKGLYRAQDVSHTADTHSRDWYTDVEALPL